MQGRVYTKWIEGYNILKGKAVYCSCDPVIGNGSYSLTDLLSYIYSVFLVASHSGIMFHFFFCMTLKFVVITLDRVIIVRDVLCGFANKF